MWSRNEDRKYEFHHEGLTAAEPQPKKKKQI
jgi:hypothetical protein